MEIEGLLPLENLNWGGGLPPSGGPWVLPMQTPRVSSHLGCPLEGEAQGGGAPFEICRGGQGQTFP